MIESKLFEAKHPVRRKHFHLRGIVSHLPKDVVPRRLATSLGTKNGVKTTQHETGSAQQPQIYDNNIRDKSIVSEKVTTNTVTEAREERETELELYMIIGEANAERQPRRALSTLS